MYLSIFVLKLLVNSVVRKRVFTGARCTYKTGKIHAGTSRVLKTLLNSVRCYYKSCTQVPYAEDPEYQYQETTLCSNST